MSFIIDGLRSTDLAVLLKCRFLTTSPRNPDSDDVRWDLWVCISNKLPSDADADHILSSKGLGLLWWFSGKESTCQCRRHRFKSWSGNILGFPCGSAGKKIHLQCGRPGFNPWAGMIPWRRERLPTLVLSLHFTSLGRSYMLRGN